MEHLNKQLFRLPEDVTYLNTAYMSPQLKTVETAGIESVMRKSQPYTITPQDFFTDQTLLKKRFAELIDASNYEDIAIVPSVSYGMANVAQNIEFEVGDEILLVDEQFPSNVYAWEKVAGRHGAKIIVAKPPSQWEGRGEQWNQTILEAITPKTKVVSMCHVHWADGTLFDLLSIRKKTKAVNALLVIDGTQSVGALPFSISELQPDALICGGYKWLMGPYALGLAYYGDYFKQGTPIEEGWLNRKHSDDFTKLTEYQTDFLPGAWRYSVGESSNFILVPMLLKGIEQLLEWGPKNIQNHCDQISKKAITTLREKGCSIEVAAYRSKHLFGIFLAPSMDIKKIKENLNAKNIYVSQRGSSLRISCHLYNDVADFDALTSCF